MTTSISSEAQTNHGWEIGKGDFKSIIDFWRKDHETSLKHFHSFLYFVLAASSLASWGFAPSENEKKKYVRA